MQPRLAWLLEEGLERPAWLGHLWEVSRKRKGKASTLRKPPSSSHLNPFPRKGCVLEKSTPFQLKCHSQISCWRGKLSSTHALFFEHLLKCWRRAPSAAPHTTYTTGARAHDPGPPAGLPLRLGGVLARVAVAGPGNTRLIRRGRLQRARGGSRLSGKTVSP